MRLWTRLLPLRRYIGVSDDEPYDGIYMQSLLSVQIDRPEAEGSGRFRVTVKS